MRQQQQLINHSLLIYTAPCSSKQQTVARCSGRFHTNTLMWAGHQNHGRPRRQQMQQVSLSKGLSLPQQGLAMPAKACSRVIVLLPILGYLLMQIVPSFLWIKPQEHNKTSCRRKPMFVVTLNARAKYKRRQATRNSHAPVNRASLLLVADQPLPGPSREGATLTTTALTQ